MSEQNYISDSINETIKKIAKNLINNKQKVAVAESCTGGMLAQTFTSLSGSSRWFEGGFVTYSNISKISLLGVNAKVLDEYGAVSEQVAEQMVHGVMHHLSTDAALSITGVAGPEGGSDEKPVGTVYIACALLKFPTIVKHFVFSGDRHAIRVQSVHAAASFLLDRIS